MKLGLWEIEEVFREYSKIMDGHIIYIPEGLFHYAAMAIKKLADKCEEETYKEAMAEANQQKEDVCNHEWSDISSKCKKCGITKQEIVNK